MKERTLLSDMPWDVKYAILLSALVILVPEGKGGREGGREEEREGERERGKEGKKRGREWGRVEWYEGGHLFYNF